MTQTLNLKIVSNCLVAFSLLLITFAIFQIGLYTRERCLIGNYENRVFALSEYNKSLTVNFSKVSSLANVDNYVSDQNFTEPRSIKYIKVLEGSIAAKK
jgi:hypothetical protein